MSDSTPNDHRLSEPSFDPVPRPASPTAVKEGGRGTGFSPDDTGICSVDEALDIAGIVAGLLLVGLAAFVGFLAVFVVLVRVFGQ